MKKIIVAVFAVALSMESAFAVLAPNANLSIDAGSNFGMQVSGDFWIDTAISGNNGISLGTVQPASGSHAGVGNGTENPDIDQLWFFSGNTGKHQTLAAVNVLTDDGSGNITLDFSGWAVTWNGGPDIAMGSGSGAGVASMTCATDCSVGDSYTLNYLATVPNDGTSGFGGVEYRLNLTGTISGTVLPPGPLPVNTLLTIEPTDPACPYCGPGSYSFIEITAPDITVPIEPGTDGGIIIGKSQASGGQEQGPSADNATPGELNAAWYFYGAYGTYSILPGDASNNIYHSESCSGIECIGKTEINELYYAWDGLLMDIGGGTVRDWTITTDASGNSRYYLYYIASVADGPFTGVGFRLTLIGNIILPPSNNPPVVNDVNITGIDTINWTPDFTDDPGDVHVCAIAASASNGYATVNPDCTAGTYTGGAGFIGLDNFTYSVTDQGGLSVTGTVNVIYEGSCVAAITCPTSCEDDYPMKQVITTGGGQSANANTTLQISFIGHITTEAGLASGGKNTVKLCPGTTVDFEVTSSVGAATCIINSAAAASSGTLAIGDKLICTNKPDGRDIDRFSIKNGI